MIVRPMIPSKLKQTYDSDQVLRDNLVEAREQGLNLFFD
jgi:hypothetical protein